MRSQLGAHTMDETLKLDMVKFATSVREAIAQIISEMGLSDNEAILLEDQALHTLYEQRCSARSLLH